MSRRSAPGAAHEGQGREQPLLRDMADGPRIAEFTAGNSNDETAVLSVLRQLRRVADN
ncbi:hypothetical protein [Nocardia sp. NPDC049526]|uniref:hypothetical protein n=1 Tax=Nocardia sp. NPDC049526 TaxID=3364316 RepID=UPI00379F4D19